MRGLILVTTKPGREESGEIEVLDCLLRYDPTVEVRRTEFAGVLLVETALPPQNASDLLRKFEMTAVLKVVPFDICIKTDVKEIVAAVVQLAAGLINSSSTFAVACTRRGRFISSSVEVEKIIGEALTKAFGARVNLENPMFLIRVEIVGEVTGVTLERK
ncbi:hypothetical protein KEJ26_02495 [Candidatus Bathyarchaeota archaeon]|nr:hypothetical protein [Candidatus Bathyarchaeota archaeon]